ncbi:hypothetical protein MC885_016977, partial [Smutsia gigantea]
MCQLLVAFASFRTQEEPLRLQQQWATEALLFWLQTALRAQNRRPFLPAEGLGPAELSQRRAGLEQAEALRSRALQQRLLQLERLESLAQCFQRKAALRESFLTDAERVLDQAAAPQASPASMEAAAQRLGMLEASLLPQEGRFQALAERAAVLQQEQYHGQAECPAAGDHSVLGAGPSASPRAAETAASSRSCRWALDHRALGTRQGTPARWDCGDRSPTPGQVLASSTACGQQPAETTELHSSLGISVEVLQAKTQVPAQLHQSLVPLVRARRALLEQTLQRAEFLHDCEEEEAWLRECAQLVEGTALGRDLNQMPVALQKQKVPATLCPAACSALHQALEAELRSHQATCADLLQRGRDPGARGLPMQRDPRQRAEAVQGLRQWLRGLAAGWGARLQAALLIQQYFADAAAAAAWLRQQQSELEGTSHGQDQAAAEALLQRYPRLERTVRAFGPSCGSWTSRRGRPPPGPRLQWCLPWALRGKTQGIWGPAVRFLATLPPGTRKMAFPAELGPDFDPNTILQTQDRLTQDSEGLQVLFE